MRLPIIAVSLALLLAGVAWWLIGAPNDTLELHGPQGGATSEAVDVGELQAKASERREIDSASASSTSGTESADAAPSADHESTIEVHLFVVDSESAAALAGVELRDLGEGTTYFDGNADRETRRLLGTTDARGMVSATVPRTVDRALVLELDTYAPRGLELDGPTGSAAEPLRVELHRAAAILAHVVGARDGEKLSVFAAGRGPGISAITLPDGYGLGGRWQATLDATGRCEVNHLPVGIELDVYLRRRNDGMRLLDRFVLDPGERRSAQWDLTGPGSLSGLCVDESGAPLVGVQVLLHSDAWPSTQSEPACPECFAKSDALGAFRFDDLPLGDWRVLPRSAPSDLTLQKSGRAQLTESEPDAIVTLTYTRSLSIAGRLALPDGESAGDVDLRLIPARGGANFGFTEPDGRFEFKGLTDGVYWLHVGTPPSKDHVAPPPLRVEAGAQDLDVRLLSAGSLRISLVDAATGAAVHGRVFVSALDDPTFDVMRMDTEGSEQIANRLRDGIYTVRAESQGGLCALAREVIVRAGEEATLELRLEPAATLDIRYEGEAEMVQVDCLLGGVLVARAGLGPHESARWNLPAGPLKIEMRSYEQWAGMSELGVNQWELVAERELVLITGELQELRLE